MVRTLSSQTTTAANPNYTVVLILLTVLTVLTALTSEGAYGQPRSVAPYRSAQSIVMNEYGLKQLTLQFSVAEVTAQSRGSRVTFPKALRKALESILSDASRPSSPLAQALFLNSGDPDHPKQASSHQELQAASTLLASEMNKKTTTLRLVPRHHAASGSPSAGHNWIFELKIPALSEKPFWVVVDKSDSRSTYNYGS